MRIWPLVVLALLAGCGGSGGTYVLSDSLLSGGNPGSSVPGLEGATAHSGFGLLLNNERQGAGAGVLQEDSRLSAAAKAHAQDMVSNNYLSHTDLDGGSAGDRALAAGYDWNFMAENIARGYTSNARVVRAWMNSPSHAANMVDPRAEDFGLGRVNDTWVLMLGREF